MVCATRVSHMRSGTLAFDSKAALIHNLAVTLSVSLSSSVVIVMSSASTATTPTISAAGPSTSSATTIPADLQASIQAAVQAAVADAMARLPPPPPPPPPPVSSVPGQYLLAQSCMWVPELRPRPLPRWPRQGRVRILPLGGRAVLRVLLASAAWPGRQCWFSHTAFPPLSLSRSLSLSPSLPSSLYPSFSLSLPLSLYPSLSLSLTVEASMAACISLGSLLSRSITGGRGLSPRYSHIFWGRRLTSTNQPPS